MARLMKTIYIEIQEGEDVDQKIATFDRAFMDFADGVKAIDKIDVDWDTGWDYADE